MLINGIELSSLGASLHNRVLTSNKVKTTSRWPDGDIEPTYIRQQDTFKSIQLQFLITELNEEDAFIVMSNLTMLLKKAIVIFDDMPNLQFDVAIVGETEQKRLANGNFLLTVNLKSDYAKGESEIHTTDTASTDSFNLPVYYYKDGNQLVATETVKIKASDFDGKENITFEDLGVRLNKHQEQYYGPGAVTNFSGKVLNYENLRDLGVLMVNYSPIVFYKEAVYFLGNEMVYDEVDRVNISFTYQSISAMTSIGQLIDLNRNRPRGYKARCGFTEEFNFENIMAYSQAIPVYFDKIDEEQYKTITLTYSKETKEGDVTIESHDITVAESDVVLGSTLARIININSNKPNDFYLDGEIVEYDKDALITFEELETSYTIHYILRESTIYIEYYKGEYPGWNRVHTDTMTVKYDASFDEDPIAALNLSLNKYKTDLYNTGVIYNDDIYTDYQSLISIGVIQIYYIPIEYTLEVQYKQDLDGDITLLNTRQYTLTDLMFMSDKVLGEIVDINLYRPEGYEFDAEQSYSGEVTLSALTQASPISIVYKASSVTRTKSIVIRYKKQLASVYSTINTAVVTIEESACGGGIKIKDLFNINQFKPEYYNDGVVDGYSGEALVTFEEINGNYDVYYLAAEYSTQIRYYTDEVDVGNWVGSSRVSYTVLSFDETTTLADLGVDINQFKPPYCSDGIVQPYGATNFSNLVNLEAINIVYMTEEDPSGDDDIDYPHRILFLQHNDMGSYDRTFPSWTLNHAYINTGVVADDISETTVAMSTVRVFPDVPLYDVNVGNAYLFGAISPSGSMYLRYENNTKYTSNPTGKNYFRGMAGNGTPSVAIEEDSSNGFSRNTGIYSSEREGYSYMTLTYSNLIQSNAGNTLVPLYLFACNYNGNYSGGIAGVGITGCKIYKNGVLVRDFIPVAYYDLIGTQVAPSNCLYDKVTKTFFEDARGLNSFNIIDDEEYEDTNPLHHIGHCYANYYKDGAFFQSRIIYFREADFVNGNVWDPEIKLDIDRYQPDFHGAGVITNLDQLGGVTFNNVNNFIFEINYPSTGYYVNVNYYKDEATQANLLASEQVLLTESMFYQVPTFGQLIPLLKYKPEGYELKQTDIPYKQNRVTFQRVLQAQPFNIVYTQAEDPDAYTNINVSYYKHKNVIDPRHPLNQYEFLGTQVISVNHTDIIDGVYPETFMDFNLMKPENEDDYWTDGQTFEWYTEDENLLTPDDLREEYVIVYEPIVQTIYIKYYTDEIDPDDFNLVATDAWQIKINDWGFGEQFQIVDELPNNYINKYKPGNCNAGELQNPDAWYTFLSLCEQGHLDILYMTKEEPHDPDDDSFPNKVLWYRAEKRISQDGLPDSITDGHYTASFGATHAQDWQLHNGIYHWKNAAGALIPYINLGYTPKELGRLAIQTKAYSITDAPKGNGNRAPSMPDYSFILGYYGAVTPEIYYKYYTDASQRYKIYTQGRGQQAMASTNSPNSSGFFAFRGHIPTINGFNKNFDQPMGVDSSNSVRWMNSQQSLYMDDSQFREGYREFVGGFRLGNYSNYDENFEPYKENSDYIYSRGYNNISPIKNYNYQSQYRNNVSWSNGLNYIWNSTIEEDAGESWCACTAVNKNVSDQAVRPEDWVEFWPAVAFHPVTMLIDAYNNFVEIYDIGDDQNPVYYNIDTSGDYDLFVDRCKPKGPITAFATTNPDTGKVNLLTDQIEIFPWIKNYRERIADTSGNSQGDEGQEDEQAEGNATPGTQYEAHGGLLEMEYDPYNLPGGVGVEGLNCPWSNYRLVAFPEPMRTLIWGIKIWDRGKLVRDLIPVAQGDEIFDYVMPENGFFDKVTEIFFGNSNEGGTYERVVGSHVTYTVTGDQVQTLRTNLDPCTYGKVVVNYYDHNNVFLGNKWIPVPTDYNPDNIAMKDLLAFNDMKPSDYYHDGMLDVDTELDVDTPVRTSLHRIWNAQAINVYYKQKQYTKTVVYYNENTRIASKDFFFSQQEIEDAETLADLGIDPELYRTDEFKPGVVMSDETIIASDDVAAFIDAPSPIVVYHKYTKEERPDLFYVEYYRGGAYEEEGQETITVNAENHNYLDCDLTGVVLNPAGAIKYLNHYHSALYEDEEMPYFIAYQVDVIANYVPIHKGPARAYTLLATITDRGRYTIIEERNGWGRLKEYPKGWILLKYTQPIVGPGQNPDYDVPTIDSVTLPFGTRMSITKMTIDRLWAYTPEFGSWIKTEEISFDQGGRLYNALALKVIHLDRLDWTNISTLEDVGIEVQKYKLRFHEDSDYTYDGAYTEEAFSDLHNIDIVYPETIYPYVVKYYQDTLDEDNVIGRGAFSCSLSDWNPDWDTFISTSYLSGWAGKVSGNPTLYRVVGKTENLTATPGEDIYILDVNFVNPNNHTTTYDNKTCYYVMYKGYIGYMQTSGVTSIDWTLRTISPVLYRTGTPLMLTWDFYDLDPNRYKPDLTYADGIVVWNPHTYDNEVYNFSFEELITTGSQKVLYVKSVDTGYMLKARAGWYKVPTGIEDFVLFPTDENPGIWDLEIKYKLESNIAANPYVYNDNPENYNEVERAQSNNIAISSTKQAFNANSYLPNDEASDSQNSANLYLRNNGLKAKQAGTSGYPTSYGRECLIQTCHSKAVGQSLTRWQNIYYKIPYEDGSTKDTYINIMNISNKRSYEKAICKIDEYKDWKSQPYFGSRVITIPESSNDYYAGDAAAQFDWSNIYIGAGSLRHYYYDQLRAAYGVYNYFYHIKVWKNYVLQHYFVFLPQGYWAPDGVQCRLDCIYDLMTGDRYYKDDYADANVDEGLRSSINLSVVDQKTNASASNFANWEFDIDDINLLLQTNEKATIYKYPDVLSPQIGFVEIGTQFLATKKTEDAENHVQGTWYNTGIGWIQGSKTSIIPNDINATDIYKTVALKGDESNTSKSYFGNRKPIDINEIRSQTFDSPYFELTNSCLKLDRYFDGSGGTVGAPINKIQIKVSGKFRPAATTTSEYGGAGYLIVGGGFKLHSESFSNTDLNDVNDYYTITITDHPTQVGKLNVNVVRGNTESNFAIEKGNGQTGVYSYMCIGGRGYYKGSSRDFYWGQPGIRWHEIKMWRTDVNTQEPEIIKPAFVWNNETYQWDLSAYYYNHDTSSWSVKPANTKFSTPYANENIYKTHLDGDYSTIEPYNSIECTELKFTTETTAKVYSQTDDYYWNGRCWIPKSYTDDYKVLFENNKQYVIQVVNLYEHSYPLEMNAYRKTNYLAGDRITVKGHLGKDENWFLLSNDRWIFNNNNLAELIVE